MGFLGSLKGKKRVKGSIGYFGLEDWWLSAFSEDERRYIQQKFQPLGSSGDSLTSGEIRYTSQTAVSLLTALAGWFSKEKDRYIAHKILQKAEELAESGTHVLDLHFLFMEKIKIYYKDRDKPRYLEEAINACKQQIKLAPKAATSFRSEYKNSPLPSHTGYEQLAIILEKQKNFENAIKLCEQAARQGWAGDWDKRIDRCKKKAEKA